jgi:hypothetical protein
MYLFGKTTTTSSNSFCFNTFVCFPFSILHPQTFVFHWNIMEYISIVTFLFLLHISFLSSFSIPFLLFLFPFGLATTGTNTKCLILINGYQWQHSSSIHHPSNNYVLNLALVNNLLCSLNSARTS